MLWSAGKCRANGRLVPPPTAQPSAGRSCWDAAAWGAQPRRETLYDPFHNAEKAKLQGQEMTRSESECRWRLHGQVHLLKFVEPHAWNRWLYCKCKLYVNISGLKTKILVSNRVYMKTAFLGCNSGLFHLFSFLLCNRPLQTQPFQ